MNKFTRIFIVATFCIASLSLWWVYETSVHLGKQSRFTESLDSSRLYFSQRLDYMEKGLDRIERRLNYKEKGE